MFSDTVWSTLIQFVLGPGLLAIIGFLLKKRIDSVANSVKATKYEITNLHPTHLRTDLDAKFSLVLARIDTVTDSIGYGNQKLDEHVEKYTQDSSRIYKTLADHERRIGLPRKVATKK